MRTATVKLDNKSTRLKLPPRAKPYNRTVAPRRLLGYVRTATGAGKWLAIVQTGRTEDGWAIRQQGFIGMADDHAIADGDAVLSYQQATAKAATWKPDGGEGSGEITVREVIRRYVAKIKADPDKGEAAAAVAFSSLRRNVLAEKPNRRPIKGRKGLGHRVVNDITLTDLREWRDSLAARMSRSSTNRQMANLKAALAYSYRDEKLGIKSDKAWKNLEPFRKANRNREEHFTAEETTRLLEEARKAGFPRLADLLEAGWHTGARLPGELAQLNVEHFNAGAAQLKIPGGKTGGRITRLSSEGVEFFVRVSQGKAPTDILLPNDHEGERWRNGGTMFRRMKKILKAAKLTEKASLYTLRHSHISRAIEGGQSLLTIAANVGNSVAVIERSYAHIIENVRHAEIERTAPRLRVVASRKVA